VLFGDGAGAFVVSPSTGLGAGPSTGLGSSAAPDEADGRGFEAIELHADGAHADKMWVPAGGSAYRPYFAAEQQASGDTVPIVRGREVFKMAVTLMPQAVHAILEQTGHRLDDVRLLVMHQANLRINEAVQQRLGLADDRVYNNIQKYGNTTAATLPMAFHEARTERGLRAGDLVCFVALGSGVTWGAALYRY
jgi:3-oxoacyl-[acyl-carrier-protein] synthase-3